jgi:hypothetical protein
MMRAARQSRASVYGNSGNPSEWQAAPIVNPDYRPFGEEELFDPSWIRRDELGEADRLVGQVYRLLNRPVGALVHLRSFLGCCGRIERNRREAKRPEIERRVIQEIGPDGTRETLDAVPDWFDHVPRELRFFEDWEQSSAGTHRVFSHWALDIRDYTHKGEREVGFIPRPLWPPKDRLLPTAHASVHLLMDRIEAIDREIGLPFGWFFLMTHGHWVDPDVGQVIAVGLRAQRAAAGPRYVGAAALGRKVIRFLREARGMDDISSRSLLADPETRRALQLDTLSAILPLERRDRLAELLTDDDVETLKHLAREGMGENSLRALSSDLAYLEALPWPASESLALKFVAHHLWDPARRETDPQHGMPADVAAALRKGEMLRARMRLRP